MKKYYSVHPDHVRNASTDELREKFLIEKLFIEDELTSYYCFDDRMLVMGLMPKNKEMEIKLDENIGSDFLLERREMGIINVSAEKCQLTVDGEVFTLESQDGIYIGRGAKSIVAKSLDSDKPAKLYVNSAPAHHTYPTKIITINDANKVVLGDNKNSNSRTIYQYIHPAVLETCQLVMGLTKLEECNMWNSMPCHTHDRRMEVYFYFNLSEEDQVCHFMGEPDNTKHIFMKNDQAVVSPAWSIHSGIGTSNYTFIWGMAGENQTFDDMDTIAIKNLK